MSNRLSLDVYVVFYGMHHGQLLLSGSEFRAVQERLTATKLGRSGSTQMILGSNRTLCTNI